MAILEQNKTEVSGFDKQIEVSSMPIILDILQKYQYQYPLKSALRELISNAIDSVVEKNNAVEILSGKAKKEDFYENIEGEEYKDSKFDESYYDLNCLGDNDCIEVTITEGEFLEKTTIEISDFGVGLGGTRLEKYFNLGYSSKRLLKNTFGKFGIGNKSALAIADMYILESCYNEEISKFSVYSSKIESIVPSEGNNTKIFSNGYIYYTIPNKGAKNYTKVTFEVKNSLFREAKENVLELFCNTKGVSLGVKSNRDSKHYFVDTYKEPVYQTESIILGKNRYYSKPYILLDGINYGYIDFEELHLTEKLVDIGIKIKKEDVTITPNRESLVWDAKTKETVKKAFRDISLEIKKLLNKKLQTTDFLEWVTTINTILLNKTNYYDDIVVAELSKIADFSKTEFIFNTKDGNQIKYSPEIISTNYYSYTILDNNTLSASSFKRVPYIVILDSTEPFTQFATNFPKIKKDSKKDVLVLIPKGIPSELIYSELKASKGVYNCASFIERIEEEIENGKTAVTYSNAKLSSNRRIKQKEKIAFCFLAINHNNHGVISERVTLKSMYESEKFLTQLGLKDTVYYTTREYKDYLLFADIFFSYYTAYDLTERLGCKGKEYYVCARYVEDAEIRDKETFIIKKEGDKLNLFEANSFYRTKTGERLILINKPDIKRMKSFSNFKPINEFFMSDFGVSKVIKHWNTAVLIKDMLDNLRFLDDFGAYNKKDKNLYENLIKYYKQFYIDISSEYRLSKPMIEIRDSYLKYLNEESEKALSLGGENNFICMKIYNAVKHLTEKYKNVKLLNHVSIIGCPTEVINDYLNKNL